MVKLYHSANEVQAHIETVGKPWKKSILNAYRNPFHMLELHIRKPLSALHVWVWIPVPL